MIAYEVCDVCVRLDPSSKREYPFANGEKEKKMEALFGGEEKEEEEEKEENIEGRNTETRRD